MPEGAYVEDVWTTAKIAIDMSGMMDGNIVYMESYYNEDVYKRQIYAILSLLASSSVYAIGST